MNDNSSWRRIERVNGKTKRPLETTSEQAQLVTEATQNDTCFLLPVDSD